MRRKLGFLAAAATVLLTACGSGPNRGLITRVETYQKVLGYPSDGRPFNRERFLAEYPHLADRVLTAPEWLEEYERLVAERRARGEPMIPITIQPGNSVTIEVVGEPELTRTLNVGAHGFDYYPYLDKVQLAGKTVEELKAEFEQQLSRFLRRPQVLIHVTGASRPVLQTGLAGLGVGMQQGSGLSGIFVFGVSSLGFLQRYEFTGTETLVQILSVAGLPQNAEWRQIRVIRRMENDPLHKGRIIICDLWNYFAMADVRQDIPLMPGDVIFVPEKWSLGEQFQKDWNLMLGYAGGLLSWNAFRQQFNEGGAFRQ